MARTMSALKPRPLSVECKPPLPCSKVPQLPPEVLIPIIEMATRSRARDASWWRSWKPFELADDVEWLEECDSALKTKHTLSLVSYQFRILTLPFLYEHLWIRHGSEALLQVLKTSRKTGMDIGRLVSRITITPLIKRTMDRRRVYEMARHIIRHCPNLRHICRPQMFADEETQHIDEMVPIDGIALPHLMRVDWYNTAGGSLSALAPSPRSIWTSKTLQILNVGPDNFPFVLGSQHQETTIDLPRVHTLCLQSLNAFGEGQRQFSIRLPSLNRLVIASPEALYNIYDGSLLSFHHQIHHLEIGADLRFLRHDFISTLIHYCRYTTDLYFPVFSTRPVRQNDLFWRNNVSFRAKRVYLSCAFPSDEYSHDDPSWWIMLENHIEGLCGDASRFNRLKAIIFCGDAWGSIIQDSRFSYSLRRLLNRGLCILCNELRSQQMLQERIKGFP